MDSELSSSDTADDTLYSRYVERLPTDLALLLFITLLTGLSVVLPFVRTSPLRPMVGFLFVLLVPGYAILAAIFPAGPNTAWKTAGGTAEYRIGLYEWIGLSAALSIGLVSMTGYLVHLSPVRISLGTLLPGTIVLTEVAICLAVVRRQKVPAAEQFGVSLWEKLSRMRSHLTEPRSSRDMSLNVLLVVFLLGSAASAGYILSQPPDRSTSFYLLGEDESGELSATALPENVTSGERMEITLGIDNHDGDRYTVVVTGGRDGTDERQQVTRYRLGPDGETLRREVELSLPNTTGRYQFSFLLYSGDVPDSPDRNNAHRTTTLTVTLRNGSMGQPATNQTEALSIR